MTYRAAKRTDGTGIVGEIDVVELHGTWWATWKAALDDGTQTEQLLRLDLVEQLERHTAEEGS